MKISILVFCLIISVGCRKTAAPPAASAPPPAQTSASPQLDPSQGGATPVAPDLALVERLAAALDCPVLAEGRYATADDVRRAFDAGAHAVVVGTAITDPVALTRRFAAAAPASEVGRGAG